MFAIAVLFAARDLYLSFAFFKVGWGWDLRVMCAGFAALLDSPHDATVDGKSGLFLMRFRHRLNDLLVDILYGNGVELMRHCRRTKMPELPLGSRPGMMHDGCMMMHVRRVKPTSALGWARVHEGWAGSRFGLRLIRPSIR